MKKYCRPLSQGGRERGELSSRLIRFLDAKIAEEEERKLHPEPEPERAVCPCCGFEEDLKYKDRDGIPICYTCYEGGA